MLDELKNDMLILSDLVSKYKDSCLTEEATKTSLVLPFIKALGYNIFAPDVLVPEYSVDFGTKCGEKVDYALFKDGELSIIFEVKASSVDLSTKHASQLFRYYTASDVRIAILTNGTEYQIYTDLDRDNIMDDTPSYSFNICSLRDFDFKILDCLSYDSFSTTAIREILSSSIFLNCLDDYFSELNDDLVIWLRKKFKCTKVPLSYARDLVSLRLGIPIKESNIVYSTSELSNDNCSVSNVKEDNIESDTLENLRPKKIVGYKPVSICLGDVEFQIRIWSDILSIILKYMETVSGLSFDYIIGNQVLNKYYLISSNFLNRVGVYEYNSNNKVYTLYYEKNISAQESINIAYKLCSELNIDVNTTLVKIQKRRVD